MKRKHPHPQAPPQPTKAVEDEMCRCRDEFFVLILGQIERLSHTELQEGWPSHHVVLQAMAASLGLLLSAWFTMLGFQEDAALKESSKLVESILSGANDIADRLLRQAEDN